MVEDLIQLPTEHGSRFYKTHTGLKLPSVTTILSQTVAKPALIPWAARKEREAVIEAVNRAYSDMSQIMTETPTLPTFMEMVDNEMDKEKAFKKELKKAGNIGTQVHARIEWEFLGELGKERSKEPPPLDTPEAELSFSHATEWRKSTNLKVIDTERKVVSMTGMYAGTLDAIVEIDGKVGVVDFKSSARVYDEHFLQNAAYRLALAEQGIKTQAGWIILLPKIPDEQPFLVVDVPPMQELVVPWLSAVALYKWIYERRLLKEAASGK